MSTIAEQLVAHPRWEWRGPMRYRYGAYFYRVTRDASDLDARCVVDLEDPATKGVLLATLREALGEWVAVYRLPFQSWAVVDMATGTTLASADTDGDAIGAALLSAWGPA